MTLVAAWHHGEIPELVKEILGQEKEKLDALGWLSKWPHTCGNDSRLGLGLGLGVGLGVGVGVGVGAAQLRPRQHVGGALPPRPYLPYISPTSPLHLPYISPTSPLHLPYISPTSSLHLPASPCICRWEEPGYLPEGDQCYDLLWRITLLREMHKVARLRDRVTTRLREMHKAALPLSPNPNPSPKPNSNPSPNLHPSPNPSPNRSPTPSPPPSPPPSRPRPLIRTSSPAACAACPSTRSTPRPPRTTSSTARSPSPSPAP